MVHKRAGALRICAYDGSLSLTFLLIDRDRDRAELFGLALLHSTRRVISPLSQIAGIQVVKRERPNTKPDYGIAMSFHDAEHIRFGCRSRDQAMHIMHATAKYLGLTHRRGINVPAR